MEKKEEDVFEFKKRIRLKRDVSNRTHKKKFDVLFEEFNGTP